MPRGPKSEKRPADMIGKIATGEIDDLTTDDGKNAAAVALGALGVESWRTGCSVVSQFEIYGPIRS